MASTQKNYATAKNPTIEAILSGMFSFTSEESAKERVDALKRSFIAAKESNAEKLVLWIKDFVTDEEKAGGYNGNYAEIFIAKTLADKFTLGFNKIARDRRQHPKRLRLKHAHPNWGHPILRGIKKNKLYADGAQAQEALQALHEEFPQSSIPGKQRLFLMIYAKEASAPARVQKYVLTVKPEENGCTIEYALNEKKPAPKSTPKKVKGFFTALVGKRKKRPPSSSASGQ